MEPTAGPPLSGEGGLHAGPGDQRLSVEYLQQWEALGAGMFIHFGMSTFLQEDFPDGNAPLRRYAPDAVDVEQWMTIAEKAGLRYAILTAKHVAGHCLWPSRFSDYRVKKENPNEVDVVYEFVNACERHKILPGLYYCSWDNHNRFGSRTWSDLEAGEPAEAQYVTREYEEFQTSQLEELLNNYGSIHEVWIDIPVALSRDYRNRLYRKIAEWQEGAVIVMNNGLNDGAVKNVSRHAWPSDVITIEGGLPPNQPRIASDPRPVVPSENGHQKWRELEGKTYYLPAEVCDPIGRFWFHHDGDQPRPDRELVGIELVARARGANIVWSVGPDPHGRIRDDFAGALIRLRENVNTLARR